VRDKMPIKTKEPVKKVEGDKPWPKPDDDKGIIKK